MNHEHIDKKLPMNMIHSIDIIALGGGIWETTVAFYMYIMIFLTSLIYNFTKYCETDQNKLI